MKDLPLKVEELQEPRNQFHAQMLKKVDSPPVSVINWSQKPKQVVRNYDWGSIEYSR